MDAKKTLVAAVLITALLAGAGMYLLRGQEIARLEQRIGELETANAELREEVASLQERNDAVPGQNDEREDISRAPRRGWETYFPDAETTTLLGMPVNEVRDLLGEPPVLLRSNIAINPEFHREIWVYVPYDEDPTGLYLFFKGNELTRSIMDEFNGVVASGLLDDAEFWLN